MLEPGILRIILRTAIREICCSYRTTKCADKNPGYKVFNADGKVVHEPAGEVDDKPAVKVPFTVKVNISDLNIRKGPGTNYDRVKFIPVGIYTIVEVKNGKGAFAGWGKLKSGIRWISLDYAKRI